MLIASLFPIWVACQNQHLQLNDDTYITLTYAKSLAHGRGFVFNYPPATLGTTTPLLALLTGGLGFLMPEIEVPRIAVFLTAACWIGIIWVLYGLRHAFGLNKWQAAVLALVIVACGWSSWLGMEAYLFAFLLTLSIALFFTGHSFLAGLSTGLLYMTRGEGVLVPLSLVCFFLLDEYRTRRRLSRRSILTIAQLAVGFLLPVLTWSAYAYCTFGRIFPETLAAKMAQGQSGISRTFLQRLTQEWLPGWGARFALGDVQVLNLWWGLAIAGVVYALRRHRRWLVFLVWIGLYCAGYSLLGVATYYWYALPILFVVELFVGLGLLQCGELLVAMGKRPRISQAVCAVLVALFLIYLAPPTVHYALASRDGRAESYLGLCAWLREHTRPGQTVSFMEVGYLGYYTDNRIVDLAGLVTPGLERYTAHRDFATGFWQNRPDYYVSLPDFDWAVGNIRNDPRLAREYEVVATLPGPRQTAFSIYKRIGIAQ